MMIRRFSPPAQAAPRRRRGAALVEMAMVAPVLMLVLLGIIEFGRAMMVGQLLSNAAREGCRVAVVGDTTNAEVIESIHSFLENAGNINPQDVVITITITPYPGNSTSGNEVAYAAARDLVNIVVQVPYSKVSYLPPSYLGSTSLAGRCSMRYE